ncbi:MAG: DNA-processing protein DprA [Bacillota bacterium]
MEIAVIGTREPSDAQAALCRELCLALAQKGHCLRTGNAVGIDQLAIACWLETGSRRVKVFLPWRSYNADFLKDKNVSVRVYDPRKDVEWKESVYKYHPAARYLSRGVFALHARNYGIVRGADVVLAFPSPKGGGTAQGIRVAQGLGVNLFVFDFSGKNADTGVLVKLLK